MAVTNDLLNTTLVDLKGPIEHSFFQKTPAYDLIVKKGTVSSEGGTLIERPIMGGSPAQGTGIFSGGETLNMARAEKTKKVTIETHRLVIPINIPKKELQKNSGKLGAIKLIDTYVDSVNGLFPIDFDRYFFGGVSAGHVFQTSELIGFNTLNGQKTFASGYTGVTAGLLEFNTPANQVSTRQNLASSTSYNYVNQYGVISSFAVDGRKVYRKVYRETAQFNPTDVNAGPDTVFMDYDSFALYEEEFESKVRIVQTQDKTDKSGNLIELTMGSARVIAAKNIVLTDFTGDAAEGVAYYLTGKGLEWIWTQKPTMSNFDDRIANQDGTCAKIEMTGAPLMLGMRMQAVVTGGARP